MRNCLRIIFVALMVVVLLGSQPFLLLEKEWKTRTLTPTNLTSEAGLHIFGDDDLQHSVGSASPNDPAIAENINTAQGTLEFWVRPNWDGDDGFAHYVFDVASSATANRILIEKEANSELQFWIRDKDDDDHYLIYDVSSWVAGVWYHVVATWDFKNDSMALYEAGILRDDAPSGSALSSDAIDALPANFNIGANFPSNFQLNGSLKYHIRNRPISAAEIAALYNSGNGNLDSFVVGPDTIAMDNYSDGVTSITYHPGLLAISSISTVTLTLTLAADTKLVAGDMVVVYDDDDPANVVYTAVATVSGTTVTVDDSCAAVSVAAFTALVTKKPEW